MHFAARAAVRAPWKRCRRLPSRDQSAQGRYDRDSGWNSVFLIQIISYLEVLRGGVMLAVPMGGDDGNARLTDTRNGIERR